MMLVLPGYPRDDRGANRTRMRALLERRWRQRNRVAQERAVTLISSLSVGDGGGGGGGVVTGRDVAMRDAG